MLCYVISCYVMLFYAVMVWYFMLCYFILCCVILCYSILFHFMLCYGMLRFFRELCWGKAMVAYAKHQQLKKEESKRQRGERDQANFFDHRFER